MQRSLLEKWKYRHLITSIQITGKKCNKRIKQTLIWNYARRSSLIYIFYSYVWNKTICKFRRCIGKRYINKRDVFYLIMLTIRISNNSSSYVGYKQDTETVSCCCNFFQTLFSPNTKVKVLEINHSMCWCNDIDFSNYKRKNKNTHPNNIPVMGQFIFCCLHHF